MNVYQALQDHGIRVTPQRVAVYEYLVCHKTHPSADMIYEAVVKQYPNFSRTTIYNSLHTLEKAGLVKCIATVSGEQRFDADTSPHGHFRCTACGGISDFPLDDAQIAAITPPFSEATLESLLFAGICPLCS